MSNPIYRGVQNPYEKLTSQFNQFKQTFAGDAKTEVQRLVESGQMSQREYNQLCAMAQQIMPHIKG